MLTHNPSAIHFRSGEMYKMKWTKWSDSPPPKPGKYWQFMIFKHTENYVIFPIVWDGKKAKREEGGNTHPRVGLTYWKPYEECIFPIDEFYDES